MSFKVSLVPSAKFTRAIDTGAKRVFRGISFFREQVVIEESNRPVASYNITFIIFLSACSIYASAFSVTVIDGFPACTLWGVERSGFSMVMGKMAKVVCL